MNNINHDTHNQECNVYAAVTLTPWYDMRPRLTEYHRGGQRRVWRTGG